MAFTRSTTAILVASLFAANAANAAVHQSENLPQEVGSLNGAPAYTQIWNYGYAEYDLGKMISTHAVNNAFRIGLQTSDTTSEIRVCFTSRPITSLGTTPFT